MRLHLTRRARLDRLGIFDFLAARSERGASQLMASLQQTFNLIERFPESGRLTDAGSIRRLPVSRHPYVVFYRVRRSTIEVVHIRHTSRHPWSD